MKALLQRHKKNKEDKDKKKKAAAAAASSTSLQTPGSEEASRMASFEIRRLMFAFSCDRCDFCAYLPFRVLNRRTKSNILSCCLHIYTHTCRVVVCSR
jgi:hypothetical protein